MKFDLRSRLIGAVSRWERCFRVPNDRIFISYRRDDRPMAWWLADSLRSAFQDERVFLDMRDIEPSRDFATEIAAHLDTCSVVVVVIGPTWKNRVLDLHREDDWVRRELVLALGSGAAVIPVFVGVSPSELTGLPPCLAKLLGPQGIVLPAIESSASSDLHAQFDDGLRRLKAAIRKNGFLKREIKAALKIVGLALLSTVALILLMWVIYAPLYAATYIDSNWLLLLLPLVVAAPGVVAVLITTAMAPHPLWSQFARLSRRSAAIGYLGLATIATMMLLYFSRPIAASVKFGIDPADAPCDDNYQTVRLEQAGAVKKAVDEQNPCNVEFDRKLFAVINLRKGYNFSILSRAAVEIAVAGGRSRAFRAPHAVDIPSNASPAGPLNLPFSLTKLQNDTPFVIWVTTEPSGLPVVASLTVGAKARD